MDNKFDIVFFLAHEKYGMAISRKENNELRLFDYCGTYYQQVIPDFPNIVCTQFMYNEDTLLPTEKGHYLKHGGVAIGLWEYYDEEGHLDHVVNMDEHFPITWPKLEQILKDKDISLLTADSIYRYYDDEKDTATWSIVIKLPMDKGCLYVFDGRTGELIKEEIIDMTMEL